MCINLAQQKLKIDNVNSSKLHYQLILKKYFNYLISKKTYWTYNSGFEIRDKEVSRILNKS